MKKEYRPAYSTRIHDADMFALAFARGIEHPAVRAVMDGPYDRRQLPDPVRAPIADILGVGGHGFCSGYRLAGEDLARALADRRAWLDGRRDDVAEPVAERIETFHNGVIEFRFCHNRTRTGYEVTEMFPMPPEPDDGDPTRALLTRPYWRDEPEAPFAALLGVVDTYLHPEAPDDGFTELAALVRDPRPPERITCFTADLRRVLAGDREGLRPLAVLTASHYEDGGDEAYLRRLSGHLYPDGPPPAGAVVRSQVDG